MNSNEILKLANAEHDALTEYCNVISALSHAVNSSPQKQPEGSKSKSTHLNISINPAGGKGGRGRAPMIMIPSTATAAAAEEDKASSALADYMTALQHLKRCHAKLRRGIEGMMAMENQSQDSNTNTNTNTSAKKKIPAAAHWSIFRRHLEVSRRALRTCASSSSTGFGPLHRNGLLRNLVGNGYGYGDDEWHEIRVVTLVSLRASIRELSRTIDVMQ